MTRTTPRVVGRVLCVPGLILALGLSARVFAQTPPAGTLRVTVVDPSGAVIVGATVTVVGAEPATSAATPAPVKTIDTGIASVAGLAPGLYTIHAEFPGFEPRQLAAVRVRQGENRQVAILALPKVEASVTVAQDAQVAGSDRTLTFGTVLTRDAIEAQVWWTITAIGIATALLLWLYNALVKTDLPPATP